MPLLRDGSSVDDGRLDRIYELDWRSLDHLVTAVLPYKALRRPRSYTWDVGQWFDQGQEGACVAHGYAHDLVARPARVTGVGSPLIREWYWRMQREDPWEGGAYPDAVPQYEGTSVLTGAKVMTDLGFYSSYRWALTAQEVAMAIAYDGPSILGLNWWTAMSDPDADGFLRPTGQVEGGHCLLAYSVKIVYRGWFGWLRRTWDDVDLDRSFVRVWNSWSAAWGENGTAKISLTDLGQLIEGESGEACFPSRTLKTTV